MTEPPIDKPENEQDRSAVVMAETVQPRGRLLAWGVAGTFICAFFVIDVVTTMPWLREDGNFSQCAAVLGSLLILRAVGFRLVRTPAPRNR